MNLLTDKEIDACLSNPSMHIQARIIYRDFARAIESAILAKLASAELPEPALPTHAKGPMFTADQLRQAYAQGAASQLDRLEKAEKALKVAANALSLALSDIDWRKDSPTQPIIHKAYQKAMEASKLLTS